MTFDRRRRQKTDYVQRLALLKSDKPRLVIRKGTNNFHIQLISLGAAGDITEVDVFSKALRKYGWKGHGGNLSSAYLTGYLAGLMALKKNIKEANVDIGLQMSVSGSSLYAAAVGARDAGLLVPVGKEAVPKMDRISGKHIAAYAQKLKDSEKYKKQFSAYIKSGMQPEDLPKHFEEVKSKIGAEFGAKSKKEVEVAK
ncbi:MAG TPA: 50S ribosomal protein L18 [archaeon]|nr:50S ribosomal protein L18 [archaeon]